MELSGESVRFGERDATGSIPGRDIPTSLKMRLAAPRLALSDGVENWSTQCQDNVTGYGIMSSVWGMILQCGSTIKVSTELPVANRHRRDTIENLLKATLNPNKQHTTTFTAYIWCNTYVICQQRSTNYILYDSNLRTLFPS